MDIKEQVRQIFISKARILKEVYHNGYNIFYFDIPEEIKETIRNNFQLSLDEEILFFRDTSLEASSSQGMVITTSGISLLPDNNSPEEIYALGWSDILKAEYKDLNIYISYYNGDLLPLEMNFLFLEYSVNEGVARYLAEILTEIASLCEPQDTREDMLSKIQMLIEEEKFSEVDTVCNEYQKKFGYEPILGWEKMQIAVKQEDFSKAQYESERLLQAIEEADNPEEWNNEKSDALNTIGYIYLQRENYAEARKYYFNSIQFSTNDETKKIRHQKFQDIDRKYSEHFAELDFNQRKLLLPVNKINSLDSKQIAVMRMHLLGALQFPIGHPIADQLYVAHPYISGRYIPFEDYDLTFLEDRLREFCWLAQCLGATEVTIESEKDTSNDNQQTSKTSYSLEDGIIKGPVADSYKNNGKYSRFEELSKRLSLNRKFSPNQKPFVPDGLVWYEHEASWKRLATQRLQDGLLEHVENMVSNSYKSAIVKDTDISILKSELIKITQSQCDDRVESFFSKKENISLRIHVTFAPINQSNSKNNNEPIKFSDHLNLKERNNLLDQKNVLSLYQELLKILRDTEENLKSVRGKNELMQTLQSNFLSAVQPYINEAQTEMIVTRDNLVWDRLVVAFFGETNAGKSTIIETFRILFDKNRKKNSDGEIVGDGQHDFTKTYAEYKFEIEGRPFTLIDVPGIEGTEAKYAEEIKNGLRKAHCVFYVQGHNKKPDSETARKIKEYLNDWVKVYSVYNVRGDVSSYDEEQEREQLVMGGNCDNENLIREEFTKILGKVYQGNVSVQALIAMCAYAQMSPKREDLIRRKRKLLMYFETPEAMLKFSQFNMLTEVIREKSNNFKTEIAQANSQKLCALAQKARKAILYELETHEAEISPFYKQLREFKRDVNNIFERVRRDLSYVAQRVVNNRFNSFRNNIYLLIDQKDASKEKIEIEIKRLQGSIKVGLESEMNQLLQRLKNDIELKRKKLKGFNVATSQNMKVGNVRPSIDLTEALDQMNIQWSDVGSLFANIGFGALGGSVIPGGAIVGALLSGGFYLAKQYIFGDGGRSKAKQKASQDIDVARRNTESRLIKEMNALYNKTIAKNRYRLVKAIDEEIQTLLDVQESLESATQSLRQFTNSLQQQ